VLNGAHAFGGLCVQIRSPPVSTPRAATVLLQNVVKFVNDQAILLIIKITRIV
jgi:hypothetical protein